MLESGCIWPILDLQVCDIAMLGFEQKMTVYAVLIEYRYRLKINITLLTNVHGITSTTGAGLLFVFKAPQQAHSELCNCCGNTEDGQQDKSVVEVISCAFLILAVYAYCQSTKHPGCSGCRDPRNMLCLAIKTH